MSVIVLSIPHTGSRFVHDQIFKDFVCLGPNDERQEKSVYDCHLGGAWVEKYREVIASNVVVIPLRHPDAVTTSWHRRGLDMHRLSALWSDLANYPGAMFLPIDSPQRDWRLGDISRRIGCSLVSDWTPYGVQFGAPSEVTADASANWVVNKFYSEEVL